MKKSNYHIVGVMSGTSLDGIDLAEIIFTAPNDLSENDSTSESARERWKFEILATETIPYSSFWKETLREGINYSRERLERLDFKYTQKLSDEIIGFIRRNNIQEIDAICSHGHTILHRPDKKLTYQIGNLPRLAKTLGYTVVCDFRTEDVKLGGQGAPLVPIGDKLLFPDYHFCLNLGGFANCSFQKNTERIAYDVCPANIVLNHYAEKLGRAYDEDGDFARSGKINEACLQMLNALPFYKEAPPKSLGLEWVKEHVFPILDKSDLFYQDALRTFTEHIAIQLAAQFSNDSSVLITGGGAYNSFLVERLKDLSAIEVIVPPKKIVEYKEALIFGLLGVLKLRNEVNCLSSVTGAEMDHSSGKIYLP